MYAVIKTGGKQYRVKAGDLLVVEKLDGEPGAEIRLGEVLMLGDGGDVTLGAPTVADAVVSATLIETRKGEKIKVFKKIRRQGYRRTRGHRQLESVLRVTSVGLKGGKQDKWDGKVDLTPKSVLDARARGLKIAEPAAAEAPAKTAAPKKAAAPKAEAKPAPEKAPAKAAEAKAPAKKAEPKAAEPKKAAAPKAEAKKADAKPKAEAKPKAAAKPKAEAKKAEPKKAAEPKRAAAPKAKAETSKAPAKKAAPKKAAAKKDKGEG